MALQESKLGVVNNKLCEQLWGGDDVGWMSSPAIGRSGCVITMWDNKKGKLISSFQGQGYLGVVLQWGANEEICVVVNVYAPCVLNAKKVLWVDLLVARRFYAAEHFCILGDFNSVRGVEERKGVSGGVEISEDTRIFNVFLDNIGLVDLPLMGRKFTWVRPNGRCMNRLDRVLVSDKWWEDCGAVSLWGLRRDVSDHCPIIVRYNGFDWGPKPFRFNNHWLNNKDFSKVVEGEWASFQVNGWMGFIDALTEDIKDLDLKDEREGLSENELLLRKDKFSQLWLLMKSKDSLEFQKSRSRWLKERDANTGFFHVCVKSRKRSNAIVALRKGSVWLSKPDEIRKEVVSYFKQHFEEVPWERPRLDGIKFKQLRESEAFGLEEIFREAEVVEVIDLSDGNKSPGPDGFNFAFYKKFWGVLKVEIMRFFQEFHLSTKLPSCFSSFFIALIPKVLSPHQVSEFRPISLLGSLYKLLSKVLASRLGTVMDNIISKSQSAFIKGRFLVDGVVVINEVVDLAKRAKEECVIFKVDFEKAYDSVSWNFLNYMMLRMGFGTKWRNWMKVCVCNGQLSVLVNESPTEQVNISRGLKQGDPLAPFLFLLVAEGLSALSQRAVSLGFFKGFHVTTEVSVSLLQYADDTLFIGEVCVENLWAMKAILRWFELMSGLKVNLSKSRLFGVNVSSTFLEGAASFLHCKIGSLPFIYLGLPVGANLRRALTWDPVVKTIQKCLFSWRNRYVSLGGRVVLINSVLTSIPVFYFSFLKMPSSVRKVIVGMQQKFLWGGSSADKEKITWVSWKDVCRPKEDGGLWVKDLKWFNISLLTKWRWRLLVEHDSLWKHVLEAKYGGVGRLNLSLPRRNKFSLWWKDLAGLGVTNGVEDDLTQLIFSKNLGCGGSTRFWLDRWVGMTPLCDTFSRRNFFTWEYELFNHLMEVIMPVPITKEDDSWSFIDGGMFTVRYMYFYLYKKLFPPSPLLLGSVGVFTRIWESWAPLKVMVFSWQALLGRLPTRRNLARRRVIIDDGEAVGCVWCGGASESENHLFSTCVTAWLVWAKILRWFGLVSVLPDSISSLIESFLLCFGKKKNGFKGALLVWHAVIWVLWRSRNERIFSGKNVEPSEIFDRIQYISWNWLLAKKLNSPCLFYEWCVNPLDCIAR
ncbi:hypothetical protein TSUD_152950 [Trifolium subterraneum]|uniref:Reverse transcriptase domain-containing protein n=1 Tax=Trifolium subterraneum TaxID=3900 RepID=A0A2Z6N7C2_TRISU|nr:hypothetical protein TSUD_152950 [Trifolium subterraneum]